MRVFLPFFACASLLVGTPTTAAVTVPREPMSAVQLVALKEARGLVRALEPGVFRQRAATSIAYRLMMRGDCARALPVMRRELASATDFTALRGLVTGALVGRDPRCLTWVANRVDAVLRTDALGEVQRAELRVQGRTMFKLAGWLGRASRVPAADLDTLEVIPESLRQRNLQFDGLSVHIELSDVPTPLENLVVGRLWAFRDTRLQAPLARTLSQRAKSDRRYFSSAGWVEVALALLASNDEQRAQQLLVDGGIHYMTLAGLKAEAALRRHDFEGAAAIFAGNTWGTKSQSVYSFFPARPEVLAPHLESIFDNNSTAELELVSFSEALDRSGSPEDAKRAAEAALKRFAAKKSFEFNRRAQAFARTGDYIAARAQLAEAARYPNHADPYHVRLGIAIGAGLSGNLAEAQRAIDEAPAGQRDVLLVRTVAALSQIPSPTRDALEASLKARVLKDKQLRVSAGELITFAQGGVSTDLILLLVRRLARNRENVALAIQAGNGAFRHGRRDTALAIAEAAHALIVEGPQADAELVELSELYWKLGLAGHATALAMRVSHPVGKVDAMTRAFKSARGENRAKLSYVTF